MVRVLYLRFLIGGLNVVFVVIVACVTLALALTISFKSLRDNADTAVSRLGAVTAQKVDDFFATPQRQLDDFCTASSRYDGLGSLPSESGNFGAAIPNSPMSGSGEILQTYRQILTAMMVEESFRYVSATVVFVDGSFLWQVTTPSVVKVGTTIFASVATWKTGPLPTQQHPLVTSGHVLPSGFQDPLASVEIRVTASRIELVTDLRIPQFRAFYDGAYAAGFRSNRSSSSSSRTNGPSLVSWGDISFSTFDGRDSFFLSLRSKMVNRSDFFLGYVSLGLRTNDVSAILTAGQLTPATRLVIFDADGFLFAASSDVRVYTAENFFGPDNTPGCATTNASANILRSDVQKRACRFHLRDTPIPMIQAAAQKDLAFFMQSTTAGAVRLVGSQYVYVQKLPTLEGARAFTIAMVVPEEDMIGDAAKILPICAGVTAGVVVLVAAVSLVLVWLVLRPLQGIAERMGKAARLEADDEAVSVSSLAEIGDLQRAFLEMRDELSRIRAFVPQSLLRANDTADDDDFAFDDDDENNESSYNGDFQNTVNRSDAQFASHDGTTTIGDTSTHMSSIATSPRGSPSRATTPTKHTQQHAHLDPTSKLEPTTSTLAATTPTKDELRDLPRRAYLAGAASPHVSRPGSGSTRRSASHRPSHSKRSKPRLQLSSGVRQENVSVLSMNLRGFHGAVKDGLGVERVAATVEAVLRIAQQEKGVVDSFHGDRFLVSFNAVKLAASHGIRAAIVAARVAEALGGGSNGSMSTGTVSGKQAPYALPVTAGVATGPAQVGNLGSSEMKRFSIVGPVVSQAACLERLCKLYGGASCLVPQRLFADLRTAVLVKTVDYVRVPFAERPMLVGAVLRELSQAADDEWMYQLQQAAEDPGKDATDFTPDSAAYTQHNNTIWEALLCGRTGDACGLMDTFEEKAKGQCSTILKKAVAETSLRTGLSVPNDSAGGNARNQRDGTLVAHDFGEFYNDAVLTAQSHTSQQC